MVKPYRLPTASVLAADLSADVAQVMIVISDLSYLNYPIAPADLRLSDPYRSAFLFHQLVGRKGAQLVFETYKPEYPLPRVGETYEFCSWWIPCAMDAVRDISAAWQRLPYPNDGDHDHCLLSYETLAAYGEYKKEGYTSEHGWITVEAYQEFIEQDRLRIRSQWRSIE